VEGTGDYPASPMLVPALLFLVAFGARALLWLSFPDPAFPDPLYYVNVARQLAAGEGFQVDYLWSFIEVGGRLPADGFLPVPSNAHWMPLASIVQVPFIWLLGPTAGASALPFWLAGAAVAPLTWRIALDAGMERWQAAAAGILVALPGGVAIHLTQPDNFALFMLAGGCALWLCARGLRGDRRAFVLGGLVVGVATLSRTDGVLLGVPFALAFVADLVARRQGKRARIGWAAALLCAAGFAIVVGPWLVRQLEVFGSLSPSASSGRILWVVEHDEIFSVTSETTPEAFFRQGLDPLAASRLGGLGAALVVFAVMPMAGLLVPFLLIGAWARRRSPLFAPWFVYAGALLVATTLLFAIYVTHGFFIHSAVALVPHAYVLAIAGIATAVSWMADRRAHWDARRASRVFTAILVAGVLVASAAATTSTLRAWTSEAEQRRPLLTALAAVAEPGDRVMSPDPGAYRYHGGWPGIITPNDPLPTVEEALRLYDVRWLAIERAHLVRALAPLLSGGERPWWLSPPVAVAGKERRPDGALFAVCLEPGDERCSR
jgi:4-amino-4-deoxy-L-arabinose transferase-like glycosyltransferase